MHDIDITKIRELLAQGKTLKEIATELGVSERTLRRYRNNADKKMSALDKKVSAKVSALDKKVLHDFAHVGSSIKTSSKKKKTKPCINIDLEQVTELASLGMTKQRIALALGISYETLRVREKDFCDFCVALKKGYALYESQLAKKLKEEALKDEPNIAALLFTLKSRYGWLDKGNTLEEDVRNDERIRILENVKDGKITAGLGALELDRAGLSIPDSIKMLATKEEAQTIDLSAGQFSVMSDEELERRARRRMEEVRRQMSEWLPQRQAEVLEMKETTKDSFKPEETKDDDN